MVGVVCVCVCVCVNTITSFSAGVDNGNIGIPQGTALSPVGFRPMAISLPTRALISALDWLTSSATTTAAEMETEVILPSCVALKPAVISEQA